MRRLAAHLPAPALARRSRPAGRRPRPRASTAPNTKVAQTIANLQSDITSGEQKKICGTDLAAAVVVAKLGGKSACESAVKDQVAEIDNTELEVESVKVSGETATAKVKSVYAGKKVPEASVSLVKEGGKWKIASLIAPPHAPKSHPVAAHAAAAKTPLER